MKNPKLFSCIKQQSRQMPRCRTIPALFALLCALGTYGQASRPFITTWQTTMENESITIPTHQHNTYDYTVDWGDGSAPQTGVTGDAMHTYATADTYTVSISGIFPRIYFNAAGFTINPEAAKILTIVKWGDIVWAASMNAAFAGCVNLTSTATDVPDLSLVTDMSNMFAGASAFNGNLSNWDVSNVTNMGFTFNSTAFNGDISNWNVSNVSNMAFMFSFNKAFDGDISNWDVSNVGNMISMFASATAFNRDISNWDVSKVTHMTTMFSNATVFNQDISNWDVSKVTHMGGMFFDATVFNQDISNWDVSNVTDMGAMFSSFTEAGAIAFNGDLSNWDVSKVTNMTTMFKNTRAFNGDISNWDVSNVTDMTNMFFGARAFDGDLGDWDVSGVTSFSSFLEGAELSPGNYDKLLIGWAALDLTDGINIRAGNSRYLSTEAGTARQAILDDDMWMITDGGPVDVAASFAENSTDLVIIDIDGSTTANAYALVPPADGSSNDDDNELFSIDAMGALSFKNSPDFENPKDVGIVASMNNIYAVEVTVTAVDDTETKITVSVSVTNVNESPVAVGISDRSLVGGFGIEYIDLATTITDPDGDMLTFTASSATGAVVTTAIAGTMLTLTAAGAGSSKITVNAEDKGGLAVSDMFEVTVTANTAPVVDTEISDLSLVEGFGTENIELTGTFMDSDAGDMLTLTASSGVEVATEINGSTLTLTAGSVVGGPYVVTVNAEDRGGLTANDMFEVTVTANTAPVVVIPGISDLSLMEGFGTENIELAGTFTDSDAGDMLTFTASSADEGVVTVTIAGTTLTLTGTGTGSSGITVTAEDRNGGMASDTFTVTVGDMVTVDMVTGVAEARGLRAYPNPGSESLTVEMEGTWSLVRIYDFTGRHIHVPVREQGPKKVVLDISGLTGGIYLVKVSGGGHSTVHRLVVE